MPTPLEKANSITVDGLMAAAFDRPREPRSDAYKAGVRDMLTFRINSLATPCSMAVAPYKLGTAKADAYFAGHDEGRHIWCRLQAVVQIV